MVVPFDGHATEYKAGPVNGDFVSLLQCVDGVIGMVSTDIFYTKTINHCRECCWSPFVLPEARSELAKEVLVWVEVLGEKFMHKFTSLFEAIHAFMYFHVYPFIFVCQVMQVVFCGDVIGDDGNVEAHVFLLVQGHAKVVIFDVKGEEFCIGGGDGGVEE